MIHVDLHTHMRLDREPSRKVYLRELSGYEELSNGSATELIDALLVDWPGAAARAGEAAKLTLAETDRVLAAIYRGLYGDQVECHVSCPACGTSYALSFAIADLWDAVTEATAVDEKLLEELGGPDEQGAYHLGGLRFRLPTGEDLAEVAGLDQEGAAEALRARCVLEEDPRYTDETLDRIMTLAGPTLDSDLDGVCPDCGAEQAVPFRMDEFLFAALWRESALLTREVHELARAYRWSRREILEMPRRERRQHAGLVLAEASDGRWA
ncbi:MAG: hypothetical protein WD696_07900 [Bryobacteraceae bacterium]